MVSALLELSNSSHGQGSGSSAGESSPCYSQGQEGSHEPNIQDVCQETQEEQCRQGGAVWPLGRPSTLVL